MIKTNKLSLLTIMALSVITGVGLNASNVNVTSGGPRIYFDDSDRTVAPLNTQWNIHTEVSNASGFWALEDVVSYENSDIDTATVIKVNTTANGNNSHSLMIDSSGDINLADGSVFIDKSKNRVGIGTTSPSTNLDIRDGIDAVKIDASDGLIDLIDGTSKWAINANSVTNDFDIINRVSYTHPIKINKNALTDSLVVGEKGIGIGISTPQEKLDVLAKEDGARLVLTTVGDGTYDAPQFTSRRAGSDGSGVAENTKNHDVMGTFAWRGHDGTDWTGAKALFWVRADGDWSDTSTGTTVEIRQTPKNSTTALVAMRIKNHADVYFPNGNLYVKGTKMNVPDYVFKEDYKLMPLNELKTFISKNNHLPGVTSAEEVGKAGVVNLSGLQMTLLEKVEELTLYTLQQEEALKTKASKIVAMEKRLIRVESLLTNLALDTSNMKSEKVSVNLK